MLKRAAQKAPLASTASTVVTAAASSSSSSAAAAAASSSSQSAAAALSTAGASLQALRRGVVMKLAGMMPASERRELMEQWAEEGDPTARKIKDAEVQMEAMKNTMAQAQAAEMKAIAEAGRLKQWISEHSKIKPEEASHPVLGQLISDLGYKKVYCASVRQLGSVRIWEQQRILRRDRAESIATEKRKKGFPVKIPGIITLYALPDGTYKLLDGQHRLAALKILADSGIVNKDSNYVLVEVFTLEKETEAKQLFLEINSAQPVKLIDMPDTIRPDIKGIIDGATEKLLETYPAFFKVSQNPKLPHVNVDNLRDDLYQHHIVERHQLTSPEELIEWLTKANQILSQKQEKDWLRIFKGRNMDVIEKAIAKSRKGNFFLGLDRTWLSWAAEDK